MSSPTPLGSRSRPKVYTRTTLKEKKKYVDQALEMRRTRELSWTKVSDLLGVSRSKLVKWCEEKEHIDEYFAFKPSAALSAKSKRPNPLMTIMEQIMVALVEDHAKSSCPLRKEQVQHEARQLMYNIELQCYGEGDTAQKTSNFQGSNSWFWGFLTRYNYKRTSYFGKEDIVNEADMSRFVDKFEEIASGYNPNLIFHFDEVGLVYNIDKKIKTYSTASKPGSTPDQQQHKNLVTLLLGSNSTGKDKLHPLLINHFESPRSMAGVDRSVAKLGVIFRANRDAVMTIDIFRDWFAEHFVPHVLRIAKREKIEPNALLVLDNAPVHLQKLTDGRAPNIQVLIIPANMSIVLQPLSREVVRSFKTLYARYLHTMALEGVKREAKRECGLEEHLVDYLQREMNIRHAIYLIAEAWSQVPRSMLHSGWRRLWPKMAAVHWADAKSEMKTKVIEQTEVPLDLQIVLADVEPQSVLDYYTLGENDLAFIASQRLLDVREGEGEGHNVLVDHVDYTRTYKNPSMAHILPTGASASSSMMEVDEPVSRDGEVSSSSCSSSLSQLVDWRSVLANEGDSEEDEGEEGDSSCPRKRNLLKIANYIMKELGKPCKPGSVCCGGKGKC